MTSSAKHRLSSGTERQSFGFPSIFKGRLGYQLLVATAVVRN
jgi:hypothetical protein